MYPMLSGHTGHKSNFEFTQTLFDRDKIGADRKIAQKLFQIGGMQYTKSLFLKLKSFAKN